MTTSLPFETTVDSIIAGLCLLNLYVNRGMPMPNDAGTVDEIDAILTPHGIRLTPTSPQLNTLIQQLIAVQEPLS